MPISLATVPIIATDDGSRITRHPRFEDFSSFLFRLSYILKAISGEGLGEKKGGELQGVEFSVYVYNICT